VSDLVASLRIIGQSFGYRLRMREANNLAVSVSMMVAFGLPWLDVLYRCVYALVLNVYVYLINDYCDIEVDLASVDKDQPKTRYMAEHRGAALGALVGLGAVLLGGALLHSWLMTGELLGSWLLLVAFASNTVVVGLYSAWLKRVPVADLLMMALAGGTMTIVGLPEDRLIGWKLLGLLSLICTAFEVIQVIRDEPQDRAAGITTTAVLFGVRKSAAIYRIIMAAAAVYTVQVVGSLVGLALLAVVFLPMSPSRAARTWDWVRVISGGVWIVLMAQIYLGLL
jgi:4-hydroxybenzoate polyprenyltransferase